MFSICVINIKLIYHPIIKPYLTPVPYYVPSYTFLALYPIKITNPTIIKEQAPILIISKVVSINSNSPILFSYPL